MSFNETIDAFDSFMKDFIPEDTGGDNEAPTEDVVDDDAGDDSTATQEDESPDTEQDSTPDPDETQPDEDEGDDGEKDEEEPVHKGKKSARERINEVITQRKQLERALEAEKAAKEALEERIRALEEASAPKKEQTPVKNVVPAGTEFGIPEPTADDVDENGDPKYPLGEFDPKYIRDLGRYDRAVERAYEARVAAEQAAEQAARQEAEAIVTEWNQKLLAAEKTSPNIRQKAASLVDTFADVPAEHGQALAQAIMTLDNGPAVLEYLADNLDEADEIIKLPAARAMIRLGKLDALFLEESAESAPPVKPTKAPPPPTAMARGRGTPSSGGTSLYDKMLKEMR